MNQIIPFNFDGTPIRVVTRNDDPWFVAKDVCSVLGHGNPSQAISAAELDEDEKGIISNDTLGGPQDMLIVSESGLYGLVQTSRKAHAKAFRRWIRREVVPEIRRTGGYRLQQLIDEKQRLVERQQRLVEQFICGLVRAKIEPKLRKEYLFELVGMTAQVRPIGTNEPPHEIEVKPAFRTKQLPSIDEPIM